MKLTAADKKRAELGVEGVASQVHEAGRFYSQSTHKEAEMIRDDDV